MEARIGFVCLLGAWCVWPGTLAAQEVPSDDGDATLAMGSTEVDITEEAEVLHHAGVVAYSEGRDEEAYIAFKRAYRISHYTLWLFDMARAADRMGKHHNASQLFDSFLRQTADLMAAHTDDDELTAKRTYAMQRMNAIERLKLGNATVADTRPPETAPAFTEAQVQRRCAL